MYRLYDHPSIHPSIFVSRPPRCLTEKLLQQNLYWSNAAGTQSVTHSRWPLRRVYQWICPKCRGEPELDIMALTVGYLSMLLLIRCTVLTVRYAYPVSHDYILTFFSTWTHSHHYWFNSQVGTSNLNHHHLHSISPAVLLSSVDRRSQGASWSEARALSTTVWMPPSDGVMLLGCSGESLRLTEGTE